MKLNFERTLALTLKHEGGWSDRMTDPGGATMKGITLKTYSSWLERKATKEELMNIKDEEVKEIYRLWYWEPVKGNVLSPGIDMAMFDFAVHSGPARAIMHLQALVGARMDGKMGPVTLAATGGFESKWGVPEVVIRLMDSRSKFLRSSSLWLEYGRGFSKRLDSVKKEALALAQEA